MTDARRARDGCATGARRMRDGRATDARRTREGRAADAQRMDDINNKLTERVHHGHISWPSLDSLGFGKLGLLAKLAIPVAEWPIWPPLSSDSWPNRPFP